MNTIDKKTGRFLPQIDWSDLDYLYSELKYSSNDIAKIKNCSNNIVWQTLKKQNILVRSRKEITPRMRERLNKGREKFMTNSIMASKKKYGYEDKLTKDVLFDLYVVKLKSVREISLIFGCGYSTVKNRLMNFGIHVRSFDESAKTVYLASEERRLKAVANMHRARGFSVTPVKDTTIEVQIQNYLRELGFDFFTHQFRNEIEHRYQCDIFVPLLNLVIECDGDYWHKYPIGKDIDHVRTKELLEKGFRVLRLWENDIRKMSVDDLKGRIDLTINGGI
jgi:very-short-patch-repair endonuclease